MIVKVQVPLFSTEKSPECLVYDEKRRHSTMINHTSSVKEAMGTRAKAYFHAHLDKGRLVIDLSKPAPDQDW